MPRQLHTKVRIMYIMLNYVFRTHLRLGLLPDPNNLQGQRLN